MGNAAEAWLKRAKAVLAESQHSAAENIQFTVSLLAATYGAQSPQMDAFTTALKHIAQRASDFTQKRHSEGVIRNVIAEIEGGLTR